LVDARGQQDGKCGASCKESRTGLRKSEAWAHKSQAKTGGKTPTLIQY
jgi:hypothetical protein